MGRATADPDRVESRWAGVALLRPGVFAFRGTIGPTGRHAHHAVQVLLADTELTVVDDGGVEHRAARMVLPANTGHRIVAGAAMGVVVFLGPESPAGTAADRLGRKAWEQPTVAADADLATEFSVLTDRVIAALGPIGSSAPRHPAVVAAAAHAQAMLGDGPVRTRDLAARVGLSAGRLTHLFTAQTGLPMRRYVLWLRLITALRAVAAGNDLTAAAHSAGFADSAHLSRTCRAMFGLAPSTLHRSVEVSIDDR
ncbi:bacterial regulatory helix-turn-helix s, AraC family protein [Mycobacterium kansasii 732]|uniref:HTH-type transcriptional activator RhaS n=1 Tax=Mycobacterium pseudokansasii TaxID=2341080 RepID=A0A498QQE7_9MYCO|nr:helix-turn-helix domain-containing protein [Mycobacterium pseudokansasii]EUA12180.1 bacterial regulatory helix-turn-helix s, AraC family protein [Mycobacterium kansasii 732]VAZ93700.1 HTH-type transcriptional activator RhaS [Mycobacterium pseudokansasii]VAZ94668.1 HTH-type transcriptional activator RhaS [Mycobacterium pseudokansasii]VBA49959.1 HTH-type transcriptional activator RhaS [Mycobacterium pseudokansasii]